MNASISARQDSAYQNAAFPINPLQDTGHVASQLRAKLMSLSPTLQPQLWNWLTRRPVYTLGLTDVRQVARHVRVLPAPPWSAPRERFWIRPEVASRLESAARALPVKFSLGFWEGFRPLGIQSSLWQTGLELVAAMHPALNDAQLQDVLETYIARPTPYAPHTLGRAVDVALLDATGRVLDDYAHLNVLASALREAGLTNYEPEWWHWSYDAEEDEAF